MFCNKDKTVAIGKASSLTERLWSDIKREAEDRAEYIIKRYNTSIEDYRVEFKKEIDTWAKDFGVKGISCDAKDRLANSIAVRLATERTYVFPKYF